MIMGRRIASTLVALAFTVLTAATIKADPSVLRHTPQVESASEIVEAIIGLLQHEKDVCPGESTGNASAVEQLDVLIAGVATSLTPSPVRLLGPAADLIRL